ncbi:MAG: DUF2007 domain-containing protein [Pseudomonadales bacterium]
MKLLYSADSALEAHMIVDLLERAGIEARIDGEYLQGGVGELQPMGVVSVLVEESDYRHARQLLTQWEAQQSPLNTAASDKRSTKLALPMFTFIAGVVLSLLFARPADPLSGRDYNGDGVFDEIHRYEQRVLRTLERDRDFDQRSDLQLQFDAQGILSAARYDNDFDGRYETRARYRNGLIETLEIDSNDDGFTEVRRDFRHGVLVRERRYRRNGQVHREVNYDVLGPVDEALDSDGDGRLDTRRQLYY